MKRTPSISGSTCLKEQPIEQLFHNMQRMDDEKSFRTLFDQYFTPLCHFSRGWLPSHELAEEVVLDVFAKFWTDRKMLDIKRSHKAYLFASVRNRSIDYLRKKTHPEVDISTMDNQLRDYGYDPQECLIGIETAQKINAALDKLPQRCRQIFKMSREQGMKYNEIAHTLGLSIKTVETQMVRALKSLRYDLDTAAR